ncbi:MAG: hypothetical protein GY856_10555 [bacterium]|nr:hypothetical protein [bacterium]
MSVNAPARISRLGNRTLRAALYMPAQITSHLASDLHAIFDRSSLAKSSN